MHSLSVMLKPASGQCNMHCDYCFYCDEMEQRAQASYGFMSEETLQNVIRKTMLNADREISFSYQGGEPTLAGLAFFEKAVELQRKYNRKGIRVHNALQTNGYALNEKWCQFFVRHQFLIGLSTACRRRTMCTGIGSWRMMDCLKKRLCQGSQKKKYKLKMMLHKFKRMRRT